MKREQRLGWAMMLAVLAGTASLGGCQLQNGSWKGPGSGWMPGTQFPRQSEPDVSSIKQPSPRFLGRLAQIGQS